MRTPRRRLRSTDANASIENPVAFCTPQLELSGLHCSGISFQRLTAFLFQLTFVTRAGMDSATLNRWRNSCCGPCSRALHYRRIRADKDDAAGGSDFPNAWRTVAAAVVAVLVCLGISIGIFISARNSEKSQGMRVQSVQCEGSATSRSSHSPSTHRHSCNAPPHLQPATSSWLKPISSLDACCTISGFTCAL